MHDISICPSFNVLGVPPPPIHRFLSVAPSLIVFVCVEKQKAELTQQHTEWVRQVTQRHMQQIEDLQNELQTHTEMLALQQVKSANPQIRSTKHTSIPIHRPATSQQTNDSTKDPQI